MKSKDSLGDRMKRFEDVYRFSLTPRTPLIIRLDGKSFSKYTKKFTKPFDENISIAFQKSVYSLFENNIQGLKLAYTQSDEVSLLINDFEKFDTQPWFDRNIQKIVSVCSSILTANFNKNIEHNQLAYFDARAFVIPKEDVCNYFYWRQQDAIRNSISMLAQKHFSSKELLGKSSVNKKEMLSNIGASWDQVIPKYRKGFCIYRSNNSIKEDFDIPIFSDNRDYINQHIKQIEE